MIRSKPCYDPKGNVIIIPSVRKVGNGKSFHHLIEKVILTPSYMISASEVIYFIKLVSWELNLLVRARATGNYYIVEDCIENPSLDFVSELLKKGGLTSFR